MLILFMLFVLEVVVVEEVRQEVQTYHIRPVVVEAVVRQLQLDYIMQMNYQTWCQLSLLQEERVVPVP
jgi:hypothetical protein